MWEGSPPRQVSVLGHAEDWGRRPVWPHSGGERQAGGRWRGQAAPPRWLFNYNHAISLLAMVQDTVQPGRSPQQTPWGFCFFPETETVRGHQQGFYKTHQTRPWLLVPSGSETPFHQHWTGEKHVRATILSIQLEEVRKGPSSLNLRESRNFGGKKLMILPLGDRGNTPCLICS